MRKVVLLLLTTILTVPVFASVHAQQLTFACVASTNSGTTISCSGHFHSATQAGSLLVLAVGSQIQTPQFLAGTVAPTINLPKTTGVTWVKASGHVFPYGALTGFIGELGASGGVSIYYLANAPVFTTSTNITFKATASTQPAGAYAFYVAGSVIEVQGMPTTATILAKPVKNGANSTPTCGNATTSFDSFAVVLETDVNSTGFPPSRGAGYGPTVNLGSAFDGLAEMPATNGNGDQIFAPGTIAATFGSSVTNPWSCTSVFFQAP